MNVKPKKHLDQHFLHDARIIKRIADEVLYANFFFGCFILFFLASCSQQNANSPAETTLTKTALTAFEENTSPVDFAPELWIKGNTYKGCFSVDYSTFYFFRNHTANEEDYRIFQSTFDGNKWRVPEKISFSDKNSDVYPMISTVDPNILFFTSYRRIPGDTSKKPNANFWISEKKKNTWSNPHPFNKANLVYNYNSQPCMATNGDIYFTSYPHDWSAVHTYVMEFTNGTYSEPKLFSPLSDFREADTARKIHEICMSPGKEYMVLSIKENDQEARLFISYKKSAEWTNPVYLGDIIHADMTGNFPYITPDGKFLLFTRAFSKFLIVPVKTFVKPN